MCSCFTEKEDQKEEKPPIHFEFEKTKNELYHVSAYAEMDRGRVTEVKIKSAVLHLEDTGEEILITDEKNLTYLTERVIHNLEEMGTGHPDE